MEIITTTKGKPCLVKDGHLYRVQTKTNIYTNWLCVNYERSKCRGRLKIANGKILAQQPHSCPPDETSVLIKKRMHNCRKRVREEKSVPISQIFKEEFQEFIEKGLDSFPNMPNYENYKSSLYKARREAIGKTQNPGSSSEIQLSEDILEITEGNRSMKIDDGSVPDKSNNEFGGESVEEPESVLQHFIKEEPVDDMESEQDLDHQDDSSAYEDFNEDPLNIYNESVTVVKQEYDDEKETSSYSNATQSNLDTLKLASNNPGESNPNKVELNENYIDEDKAFLLSLLPTMKELSGPQKMEFKMTILDVLRRLRYPNVEPTGNRSTTILSNAVPSTPVSNVKPYEVTEKSQKASGRTTRKPEEQPKPAEPVRKKQRVTNAVKLQQPISSGTIAIQSPIDVSNKGATTPVLNLTQLIPVVSSQNLNQGMTLLNIKPIADREMGLQQSGIVVNPVQTPSVSSSFITQPETSIQPVRPKTMPTAKKKPYSSKKQSSTSVDIPTSSTSETNPYRNNEPLETEVHMIDTGIEFVKVESHDNDYSET